MTNSQKLKIGRISYANLFPIFYILQKKCDCSGYEFVDGVPSELNKKVRKGEIDISPSSSIEYIRNQDRYILIENNSISSKGPVGSILLFSRRPIETLNGLTILASSQSETSVVLLQIIFKKFYEIECRLKSTAEPLGKGIKSHSAYMLIGDEALTEALKWPKLFIYDLAELWYKHTGLPFTFAFWIARRDCCVENTEMFKKFTDDLNTARAYAVKNFKTIASESYLINLFSEEELVLYWKGISYDFGNDHKKGFDLFRDYAEELCLI